MKSELEMLNDVIQQARCPACGDHVFVPAVRLPSEQPDDPTVWCRDHGHWEGRLSDCRIVAEFELSYFDDDSFKSKLELLSKIEAAFDDDRNPMPPEWFYFSDLIPVGKKAKFTIELI